MGFKKHLLSTFVIGTTCITSFSSVGMAETSKEISQNLDEVTQQVKKEDFTKLEKKWLETFKDDPYIQEYYDRTLEEKKEFIIGMEIASRKAENSREKVEKDQKMSAVQRVSSRWGGPQMGSMGDVLVTLDNGENIGDKRIAWGHSGIVADDRNWVFEANPKGHQGQKSGVQRLANYWNYAYRDKSASYVKGASSSQYRSAQHYAWAQWTQGKPYSIFDAVRNERSFYCSKLVWLAWYNQGYNLDPTTWNGAVWPSDLRDSSQTIEY